jgi:hypothetical protein
MAKWREIAKLLDSCHSLFLKEIGEPQENVLRLLLVEAERSDEAESMQVGGAIIEDLHRVQAPTITTSQPSLRPHWKMIASYQAG